MTLSVRTALLGCLLLASAGCTPAQLKMSAIKRRAPTDLSCSNIEVRQLSSTAYVARGCDTEITYTCRCAGYYGYSCMSTVCSPDLVHSADTSGGAREQPAAGCQYDTQCKGERVCRASQCVDPAPTASHESIAQH
jgi:hypothetical protein